PCSEFNGTYLLTAGGGPGCSYRYSGAPAGGSAFVCVPVFVLMGLDFNYNAATDTTTITWGFVNEVSGGIGGGTATRSGKPDCRSSHFGTLTVSGPANLTTGEGTDTYCDTTITIVFTSLYSP
ncbi:MAG TPA: hypothetical protein VHY20_02550, partial [Pirellulales bacterium]|nr:hypothetical protein [Pirellulales bacterium]